MKHIQTLAIDSLGPLDAEVRVQHEHVVGVQLGRIGDRDQIRFPNEPPSLRVVSLPSGEVDRVRAFTGCVRGDDAKKAGFALDTTARSESDRES